MARLSVERLSDFGDFSGSEELADLLTVTNGEHADSLADVRLSPDGRHIHVILRAPHLGLVTFDKYERPQLAQNQKRLDLRLTRTVPIVDVLYLDHHNNNNSSSRGAAVVAVVYESGKVEFWKFLECKPGWHLLQSSDLCNSPRARLVSACVCSNLIIWCEERPPSGSPPAVGSTRSKLTYCVCRRDFEVDEGSVGLGGVKIALHNNPRFSVVSAGDCVHLLPDLRAEPPPNVNKFFLSWSPRQDSFTVSSTCKNTPLKKLSAKESDFKKLLADCVGYLSALEPPEIHSVAPTACGGLLLLLSTGWLCHLQKDGVLRQMYKLEDKQMGKHGAHTSLCLYRDTLALLSGQNLHLIDFSCGRELEKTVLKRGGVLYPNRAERWTPHLLSETGLYALVTRETDSRDFSSRLRPAWEGVDPGALLVEAVFEEACKYYQQRSLSSTQLTVDTLKKGGRFQAPISLASILRTYLSAGSRQKGVELSQNGGGGGGGGFSAGQEKLMGSLEPELKALVSLEEVKGRLVKGGVKEVEALCGSLVEKEVARLLSFSEMDREALLYLNSIFGLFPAQAWGAAQAALQLSCNGKGGLSSGAPADVWKSVLSPAPGSAAFANGGPKHSLKGEHVAGCRTRASSRASSGALPVFELLCQSVFLFRPGWLPGFLELAQQQQGSAGLGLSLAASTWSFPGGRGGEGGENNVPLYKRALCTLSALEPDREQQQHLEVELLLVSGRPNAILQALRLLMAERQWERVTQVAHRFCAQSPLLNKEIFTSLLCEVAQHRDLDPFLDLLWSLCPEDYTVTTILNLVLKNLPAPSSSSSDAPPSPAPFADPHSSELTIGLLKPLLRKVLQRETKPSQHYADILQSPSFPPPALPRQPAEPPGAASDPDPEQARRGSAAPAPPTQTPAQPTHTTMQRTRVPLPPNPV